MFQEQRTPVTPCPISVVADFSPLQYSGSLHLSCLSSPLSPVSRRRWGEGSLIPAPPLLSLHHWAPRGFAGLFIAPSASHGSQHTYNRREGGRACGGPASGAASCWLRAADRPGTFPRDWECPQGCPCIWVLHWSPPSASNWCCFINKWGQPSSYASGVLCVLKHNCLILYTAIKSWTPFPTKTRPESGKWGLGKRKRVGERLNSLWYSMPVDDSFKNISRDILGRHLPAISF